MRKTKRSKEIKKASRVLFISRGKGHGHAIQDLSIAKELLALSPELSIQFASYSTGLTTFRRLGSQAIDLELPENPAFLLCQFKCIELLRSVRPDVVVVHEEFAALSAAHICAIPSVYIAAWLPRFPSIAAESLVLATSIIALCEPGLFPVPPALRTEVEYVGFLRREMRFTSRDRLLLRKTWGISRDALVIAVVTGGAASEENAPVCDLLLSTFAGLQSAVKYLYWVSEKDEKFLSERCRGIVGVSVHKFIDPIEKLIACADLVITKGTRGIVFDAEMVGVPTISLATGVNPIDEIVLPRIRNNISLNLTATDHVVLMGYVNKVREGLRGPPPPPSFANGILRKAASSILRSIVQCRDTDRTIFRIY